jgi:hypothetical protein
MPLAMLTHSSVAGAFAGLGLILLSASGIAAQPAAPDFSGQWGRDMLFFEPPASGPGPLVNAVRKPDGSRNTSGPCCAIIVEGGWAGDDTNPILKSRAAEAVKKYRELADAGVVVQDRHNTCWPEPPPYSMALHFGVNILQTKNEVTIVHLLYNTVRRIRLNALHPENLKPSWQGDSIGWFEGDTLVVDTKGIRTSPFTSVDAFGTPHSEALHVVERYRLIDGAQAAEQQKKHGAMFRPNPPYGRGTIDPDVSRKGLQVEFTVSDDAVFTTPWSGRVTYRPLIGDWPEAVCAENPNFHGLKATLPVAEKPDF